MSRKNYILAIDQSTSATKAMIFGSNAELNSRISIPHKQYYPQPGFVEHDPVEIYSNTVAAVREVLAKSNVNPSVLSITNQRETSMVWNRHTGLPMANAAVWQCQRGIALCDDLIRKGYSKKIQQKTGLIINSYFSASKLAWIINNTPGARESARNGELLTGTMDTWLLWKLTGGMVHATDHSNACRTMLFNINTLKWDEELIDLFNLHPSMFPQVKFSDEIFGSVSDQQLDIIKGIPISGLIGDSHGALFGQQCYSPGLTKATYGTGSSIMMNIGKSPKTAPEGLVTSVGFSRGKTVDYVFEGNIHCTGDTINWLANDLELIESPAAAEQIALSVDNNGGVYLVPAFVGLGAPHWDNEAKACICGMGRNSKKAHVVRAALESIAYQIKDLIDLMIERSGVELKELRVDGGPTRNEFLMQFQTDILQKPVVRSGIEEISALGSAMMAGLATGIWKDIEDIRKLKIADRIFTNNMKQEEIKTLYEGWKLAVKRTRFK